MAMSVSMNSHGYGPLKRGVTLQKIPELLGTLHCQQRKIATGCMPAYKTLLVKGINFGLNQKCIELLPTLKLCV